MTINQMVINKLSQWSMEALIFNAQHGAKGGQFVTRLWANGETMVGPPGCRTNQEIPVNEFETLKANGWKIMVG